MFYEQFRALCKVRNETPSHVLECIGLTRMNASLWKKGGMPSAENIQKLANYFGVPVDYLLNTNAAMSANSSNMHRIISDAEIATRSKTNETQLAKSQPLCNSRFKNTSRKGQTSSCFMNDFSRCVKQKA